MYCKQCRSFLGNYYIDDVACPICGFHNMGVNSSAITVAPQTSFKHPVINNKLAVLSSLVLIFLFSVLFLQQNYIANSNLQAAILADKDGNYKNAATLLGRPLSPLVLPVTKHSFAKETKQNHSWQIYENYRLQASELVKDKKYSDALLLLNKIPKEFPSYKAVERIKISTKAAIGTADAKAAVDAKAVIDAKASKIAKPQSKDANSSTTITKSLSIPQPTPTTVSVPRGKRFTSTSASSALESANTIASAQSALQTFFDQYGLTVEINTVTPSSFVNTYDTYSTLSAGDLSGLKTYGAILIDEWAKYPTDWVASSSIQDIILVKSLAIQGQFRSATPDPIGHAMYYDTNLLSTSGETYARQVTHHEYDHLIEYNYFGSWNHSDPQWLSLNPPGFSYGNGGISCYSPGNCQSGPHVAAGFATGYAMSAIEEDKAELYAYLMGSGLYQNLKSWVSSDSVLASKVNNYKQFISSHSSSMSGSYFDDINP